MSNIPKARELLGEAFLAKTATEKDYYISAALKLMTRVSPIRRTKVKSRKVTRSVAAQIRAYAAKHPGDSETEIAVVFSVNPGRVSEALHHER